MKEKTCHHFTVNIITHHNILNQILFLNFTSFDNLCTICLSSQKLCSKTWKVNVCYVYIIKLKLLFEKKKKKWKVDGF